MHEHQNLGSGTGIRYHGDGEAEEALISWPHADSTVSLGNVQHKGSQRFIGRAERKAFANVGQRWIRRFVGQTGVRGHPADGAIHDQTGWTVGGDHYT